MTTPKEVPPASTPVAPQGDPPVNLRQSRRGRPGFVTLRLVGDYDPVGETSRPEPAASRLADVAAQRHLPELMAVLARYDVGICNRAFLRDASAAIQRLERAAAASGFSPLHSLASYWRIDARHVRDLDGLVGSLNALTVVDIAYAERAVVDPSAPVRPEDDRFARDQHYVDAAPAGIDARWTWTQPDCQGAGIGLCDLEGAWGQHHLDLKDGLLIAEPFHGVSGRRILNPVSNLPYGTGNHGAAVLGITVARDNRRGIVGIAPAVSDVTLLSHYVVIPRDRGNDLVLSSTYTVASAILAGINVMRAGDVLLLEVQTAVDMLPVEIDDIVFDAIRLAVAHGIVVVEAAGNGSKDLDQHLNEAGRRVLAPTAAAPSASVIDTGALPDFGFVRDSGAGCRCWSPTKHPLPNRDVQMSDCEGRSPGGTRSGIPTGCRGG